MSQGIMVVAEQSDGAFRKVAFEILSEGKRIADSLDCQLTAVVLGSDIEACAQELQAYGPDRILAVEDSQLAEYLTDAYTNALSAVIRQEDPNILLFGASVQGKDLSARIAARFDAPLATDCVAITCDGGGLIATRPIYGGKLLANVVLEGERQMFSVRPNITEIVKTGGDAVVEKISAETGEVTMTFIEKRMETGKVDLTEANIVVSGGRGMGGDDYSVIEALAEALGAAVGASRAAVDEGWRSHSDQVGQTGKVVSPGLYMAFGISGAIQHLAGMSSSKVIVAINNDSEAPIFAKADYAVVADLFEIAPYITEEIQKISG
jgi:electron transfer flavoprotein alpha subunit